MYLHCFLIVFRDALVSFVTSQGLIPACQHAASEHNCMHNFKVLRHFLHHIGLEKNIPIYTRKHHSRLKGRRGTEASLFINENQRGGDVNERDDTGAGALWCALGRPGVGGRSRSAEANAGSHAAERRS